MFDSRLCLFQVVTLLKDNIDLIGKIQLSEDLTEEVKKKKKK